MQGSSSLPAFESHSFVSALAHSSISVIKDKWQHWDYISCITLVYRNTPDNKLNYEHMKGAENQGLTTLKFLTTTETFRLTNSKKKSDKMYR